MSLVVACTWGAYFLKGEFSISVYQYNMFFSEMLEAKEKKKDRNHSFFKLKCRVLHSLLLGYICRFTDKRS